MKTKKIIAALAAVLLLAACGKQKNCVDPYPGDSPLTVVPGLELGKGIDQIGVCSSIDDWTWEWDREGDGWIPELPQGSATGVYVGIQARYNLLFADTAAQELKEVHISPSYNSYDTAEVRILRDSLVFINSMRYGTPRCLPYSDYLSDYGKYSYEWEICNGVHIYIRGTTSLKYPSDSIYRDLVVSFTR